MGGELGRAVWIGSGRLWWSIKVLGEGVDEVGVVDLEVELCINVKLVDLVF